MNEAHRTNGASDGSRPMARADAARLIGIHDREFTLFQLSGLLAGALERGALNAPLKDALGLGRTWRHWPAATVSYAQMRSILEQLWHGADRTLSIFDHAARINFTSFGAVGLASMAFRDGEEGIRFCVRNFRTAWEPVLEPQPDGTLVMQHSPRFFDPEMRAALELFHFVNCFSVSRSRAAGIPVAQHVALTSDAGVSQRALEDFFGCKVTVGVEVAGVHFTREWLRRPVSSLDEVLRNKLLALCQDEIRADEAPAQTLLQYIEKSGPAIRSSDDMARTLGISRRTLGRMFEREGVSYSTLAREVGLRRARNLLRKGDSVDQVAESLGFSEERSFRRAFKSWTGSTPAEYRARALATASQSGPTERGA